jgi:anti-anti-sigma factor
LEVATVEIRLEPRLRNGTWGLDLEEEAFRVTESMNTEGVLTLGVIGDLDAKSATRLTDALGDWSNLTALVVDLRACTLVDSCGLRALLDCRRGIGDEAGMSLFGVSSDVAHIVRLAGLEVVLGLDPAS